MVILFLNSASYIGELYYRDNTSEKKHITTFYGIFMLFYFFHSK